MLTTQLKTSSRSARATACTYLDHHDCTSRVHVRIMMFVQHVRRSRVGYEGQARGPIT